jgi:hypothetical protein
MESRKVTWHVWSDSGTLRKFNKKENRIGEG